MYRWVEHTAELELAIEAPTEEEVFAEALAALGELLDDEGGGGAAQRELELQAADRPELLAAWLDELVYLADVDGFVPEQVLDLRLGDEALRATVAGRCGEPRPLVKAITRHRLDFRRGADGVWGARVVLDV